jgi:L-2-hydroxyglutarate oxidase LhgO
MTGKIRSVQMMINHYEFCLENGIGLFSEQEVTDINKKLDELYSMLDTFQMEKEMANA